MTKDTRNEYITRIGPGRHYAILKRRKRDHLPRNLAVVVFLGILMGVLIGFALGMAVTHLAGMVEVMNG